MHVRVSPWRGGGYAPQHDSVRGRRQRVWKDRRLGKMGLRKKEGEKKGAKQKAVVGELCSGQQKDQMNRLQNKRRAHPKQKRRAGGKIMLKQ